MKIVIEIGKKNYKNILNGLAVHRCVLFDAIKKGTPLPKAYWIERFDDEDKWLECSNCHCDSDDAYKYCPNCGAEMESEE